MEVVEVFIQVIADAGVYAVLLVLAFYLFYKIHKNDVNKLESIMDKSIEAIKQSYKDSHDSLNEYIEKYAKERPKK